MTVGKFPGKRVIAGASYSLKWSHIDMIVGWKLVTWKLDNRLIAMQEMHGFNMENWLYNYLWSIILTSATNELFAGFRGPTSRTANTTSWKWKCKLLLITFAIVSEYKKELKLPSSVFGSLISPSIEIGVKLYLINLSVRPSIWNSSTGVRGLIVSWHFCSTKRNFSSVVLTLGLVIEYVWNSLSEFSNNRMLAPKIVAWIFDP